MDGGLTGIVIFITALAALAWLALIAFRSATLTAKLDLYRNHQTGMPALGTEAIVVKTLRPSGTVRIANMPYDATSEGEFLSPGTEVVVIGSKGRILLVREKNIQAADIQDRRNT